MSVDGNWNVITKSPMGEQQGTLSFVTQGSVLTGRLTGAAGDAEIEQGSVDGDQLQWQVSLTSPMTMTLEFSATVSGDEISGSVKLGSFGNAEFQGTRA